MCTLLNIEIFLQTVSGPHWAKSSLRHISPTYVQTCVHYLILKYFFGQLAWMETSTATTGPARGIAHPACTIHTCTIRAGRRVPRATMMETVATVVLIVTYFCMGR